MNERKREGSSRVEDHSFTMCVCVCFRYRSSFCKVVVFDARRDRFTGEYETNLKSMGTRYRCLTGPSPFWRSKREWVDTSG